MHNVWWVWGDGDDHPASPGGDQAARLPVLPGVDVLSFGHCVEYSELSAREHRVGGDDLLRDGVRARSRTVFPADVSPLLDRADVGRHVPVHRGSVPHHALGKYFWIHGHLDVFHARWLPHSPAANQKVVDLGLLGLPIELCGAGDQYERDARAAVAESKPSSRPKITST